MMTLDQLTPALNQPRPMPLVKLVNLMGATRGEACYREVLSALAIDELRSANDNARFGEELISRGGVLATIGRSIKIQAILHGASNQR